MSVMHHGVDIQCDNIKCGQWTNVQAKTAAKARRILRAKGWIYRNEKTGKVHDYCPLCRDNYPPMHKRINHV